MNPFLSVVVKTTLACDIDCRHCYHRPEERVPGKISIDNVERLFRMVSREYESAWFIWHGGEPLTLPLQFYKQVIELEEKYFGMQSNRVGNTIQTNGVNIDRKFANFCRDNKINIGVSYEGPYNDILRQKSETVDRNLAYLSRKEHVFSVNSTVSSETVGNQNDLYRHFRDRGINLALSKVMPAGCSADGSFVPDADEFISNSIAAFDEWLYDAGTDVPLVPHYLYVCSALGDPVPSDCAHTSCLTKWLCVYPNGDLYPCAKNCPAEYRMCNISEIDRITQAFSTEGFGRLLRGTIARREKCQAECDMFGYCNGGCSMDACFEGGVTENGGDSCRIFKAVFGHIKGTMDGILSEKPDLAQYNRFVRDAVIGKLVNPRVLNF